MFTKPTAEKLRAPLQTRDAAIKGLAVGIVLAHNHPSGNLKPSLADEQLTAKIKEAAKYHDIRVLDHIIVTTETYYSFADEGLL